MRETGTFALSLPKMRRHCALQAAFTFDFAKLAGLRFFNSPLTLYRMGC